MNNQEKLAHFNRKIEWFRHKICDYKSNLKTVKMSMNEYEDVKRHGWLHPLQHMRGRAAELNVFRQQSNPQLCKGMGNMSVKNIVLLIHYDRSDFNVGFVDRNVTLMNAVE